MVNVLAEFLLAFFRFLFRICSVRCLQAIFLDPIKRHMHGRRGLRRRRQSNNFDWSADGIWEPRLVRHSHHDWFRSYNVFHRYFLHTNYVSNPSEGSPQVEHAEEALDLLKSTPAAPF